MKIHQLRHLLAFIIGAVVLGCLIGLSIKTSFFDAYAQNEKKIVKLAPSIKPQLKFTDLKVAQKNLKLSEGFDAESDWIKNFSFSLENISDKPIVFVSVSINFPETKSTGNMMSYQIMLGELPDKRLKDSKPISLNLGKTLEISLNKEKDGISKFINERQPIESIREIELDIGLIIFEDKTAWSSGNFMRKHPDSNKYQIIKNEPQQ